MEGKITMKYIKALGYIAAADILSLFISLTLASSSSSIIRLISAVGTTGILICLLASFAIRTAKEDLRQERITGTRTRLFVPVSVGAVTSLPALASWILLYISRSTGSFDFYKWHKLLNAYFLQIYNFINSDASVSALSGGQLMAMLGLVFVPFAAFNAAYFLIYKGIISFTDK